ncbi:hypothetical protein MD484_g8844, partial [Candolleomyces efflorescens]
MQVWRVLIATKRSGQAHGIDEFLSHRRPGNLIVHCPLCPEPYFNVDGDWCAIPHFLRHLNQLQLTSDGNHQANRYSKNSDPLSISLFWRRAYYLLDSKFKEDLERLSGFASEKTTCTHLNAAEKQDRKKFKNMNITGIINIQCLHVFVKSTVDMHLGERFSLTDLAYYLALCEYTALNIDISETPLCHITSCDLILSYDIAFGYIRHLIERYKAVFPDMVKAVEPQTLTAELTHARDTYLQHKLRFQALCNIHKNQLESWNALDRGERTFRGNNEAVFDALIKVEESSSSTRGSNQTLSAKFINEGILIEIEQRELRAKSLLLKNHATATVAKEVEDDTRRLRKRLDDWRSQQRELMPQVRDHISSQTTNTLLSEETLFLPSDFEDSQRSTLLLGFLVTIKSDLHEGMAFDLINHIQQQVKALDALLAHKRVHCRGQDQTTRANSQIVCITAQRQLYIDHYNSNRNTLIRLGLPKANNNEESVG